MIRTLKKLFGGAIVFSLLGLAACSGQTGGTGAPGEAGKAGSAAGGDKKEIVIGTTAGDFGDMVKEKISGLLEAKGYKVKLIEFSDYVRPNQALAEGAVDVNVFQHKPYLDDFAKRHNLDLTDVFQVPTAPLGIYAGKLDKLEDVKSGSTVSLANDPSNLARALVMLESFGWLKLNPDVDPLTVSVNDIVENPKDVKLVELEAAQIPRSRQDVDFAIINGNYAVGANIPLTDALFIEPSYAYVNVGVVRTADKDAPWVKDVIAAYNSPEFKEWARGKYPGYKYPASWSESTGAAADDSGAANAGEFGAGESNADDAKADASSAGATAPEPAAGDGETIKPDESAVEEIAPEAPSAE